MAIGLRPRVAYGRVLSAPCLSAVDRLGDTLFPGLASPVKSTECKTMDRPLVKLQAKAAIDWLRIFGDADVINPHAHQCRVPLPKRLLAMRRNRALRRMRFAAA